MKIKKSQARISTSLTITDSDNKPIKGVTVVAFTDFAKKIGDQKKTDSKGKAIFQLTQKKIEQLYVYPDHSFWGYFKKNINLSTSPTIKLTSIDLKFTDSLRHFYDTRNWPKVEKGVRVGIIDTGVGPHGDLQVSGGANVISGEDPLDFKDNGEGHGTHVAGIISAFGGLTGLAAGIDIYSYRVFPKGGNASNFDIMKAVDKARTDGCDLINLSLGEPASDEGVMSSIKEAYASGILCFAANGNDDRSAVNFPASYSLSIAVSAMGRKGTFPASTVQTATVRAPFGTDSNNFIADFSNVGPETDLTAPGVGIISTFPNDLYAIMDGTSMACPAAVGMAARLLSGQTAILGLPRNQQRTDEMQKFLATKIRSMGFGANFEGKGMLFP
ncbi:MAG: S8 family serine peptidase [Flavisolibacter sp.]